MFLILVEDTGQDGHDTSQCSAQVDGGKITRRWLALEEDNGTINTVDIIDTVKGIVGWSDPNTVKGYIPRTLPAADPQLQSYYATRVSWSGMGSYQKAFVAPTLETGAQTITQLGNNQINYALWQNYLFTVESSPRLYPIMADTALTAQQGSYFDDSGAQQNFTYFQEWARFCDWDFLPIDDYVTQQRGGAYFKTGSGQLPNKAPFQGQPRMLLPNQVYRLLWTGVPLQYLTDPNSYLRKWRGRVNQNTWTGPGNFTFNPGELLYVGYKPTKYQPPITLTSANGVIVGIDYSKLVNIEINFLYTVRTATDLPAAPANKSYVQGGHNLLPYFPTRNYYYTVFSPDNGTTEYPMYLSFPLERLFMDPRF